MRDACGVVVHILLHRLTTVREAAGQGHCHDGLHTRVEPCEVQSESAKLGPDSTSENDGVLDYRDQLQQLTVRSVRRTDRLPGEPVQHGVLVDPLHVQDSNDITGHCADQVRRRRRLQPSPEDIEGRLQVWRPSQLFQFAQAWQVAQLCQPDLEGLQSQVLRHALAILAMLRQCPDALRHVVRRQQPRGRSGQGQGRGGRGVVPGQEALDDVERGHGAELQCEPRCRRRQGARLGEADAVPHAGDDQGVGQALEAGEQGGQGGAAADGPEGAVEDHDVRELLLRKSARCRAFVEPHRSCAVSAPPLAATQHDQRPRQADATPLQRQEGVPGLHRRAHLHHHGGPWNSGCSEHHPATITSLLVAGDSSHLQGASACCERLQPLPYLQQKPALTTPQQDDACGMVLELLVGERRANCLQERLLQRLALAVAAHLLKSSMHHLLLLILLIIIIR
mmetsp:Transcript_11840/g.42336  ORF Transcript_11840/g.42336 Transcript_11840/m.42336 type:complete len:451 (+) Transcript_11840:937-2289(+)